MEAFGQLSRSGVPRRAFLLMPLAFGGLIAVSSYRERPIPDAATGGSGSEVTVVLFDDRGERLGLKRVRKLVLADAEWRKRLTSAEYTVTRRQGTEVAYTGATWNEHRKGIYRCVYCGNALFLSKTKFDSGTGWPSFREPVAPENIYHRKDISLLIERTEVLCSECDAHLGHVFTDGPEPTGLRYCMNSAALRFISAS